MTATAQDKVDAVATRQKARTPAVVEALASFEGEIQKALPRGLMAGQFCRVFLTTVQQNPTLGKCTTRSLLFGLLEAASLGLPIDGCLGHAYLVPYGKGRGPNKTYLAQLQIGYRGLVELAYRSDRVVRLAADAIAERDLFSYHEGTEPSLRHQKHLDGDNAGALIGAYALAHLRDAPAPVVCVMPLAEVHKRRDASKAWTNAEKAWDGKEPKRDSPWHLWAESMFKKTAIRQLAKLLPQSVDLQRAAAVDELRDLGEKSTFVDTTSSADALEAIGGDE